MSRKKDLLEGRTKEWDRNDWQGRRKDQIESSYKIMDVVFVLILIFTTIGIVYNVVSDM
jgi:hypothetical protein